MKCVEVLEGGFEENSLVEEALVSGGIVVKLLKLGILVVYCLWNLIDCLLIFVVMYEYFNKTLEG